MITAPFNFVPLSEKVMFPSWSENISHDIPFEDGESGIIDITITAKSPIFIRDHENEERFSQHSGQYYIPSTSVKGMIRSVLEIMSFSKMRPESYNDSTYAVRDLNNRELYMSNMTPDKISCGWLKKEGNKYIIEDCGTPGRIKHEEIDKVLNIKFAAKFKSGVFKNKAEDKTATKKYDLVDFENLTHHFKFIKKDVNRDIYEYDKNSNKIGTIVLTGQPSGRSEPEGKKASGKVYEFLFFEKIKDLVLDELVYEKFKFAYFDDRTTEPKESPDWTFWKKKLISGAKIPVFFQKQGGAVKHFGLSYLYKLPYTHSVKDGIFDIHANPRSDMSEGIFGYVSKSTQDALKGRVEFSHFKAASGMKELESRTEILGTPRASYYPIYVQQNGKLFSTFMDNGFAIAGRKRYPIHKSNKPSSTEDTGNDNVGTTFTPLKEGVIFQGKLRYHNLKRIELGALLSSLTFHNTQEAYHNIGLAKSLGYGKIKLELSMTQDIAPYLKEYEMFMMQEIQNWHESTQIKELLSMACEQENAKNSSLRYMSLESFRDNKKTDQEDYLRTYTNLENIKTVCAASLITQEDLQEVQRQKEMMQAEQKAQAEANAFLMELEETLSSNNIQKMDNFINKYPDKEQMQQVKEVRDALAQAQEQDKFSKVNESALNAWDSIHDPKYAKTIKKSLESFINKWAEQKNNKGSEYILELVEKAKAELK
jgi:CRISPR-associated protein (TIGR03986 family)